MHIHTCMHIHTSTTTTHSLTHSTVLRASQGGLRRESRLIAVAPFSFQAQCATPTLGHNSPSPVAHHHSLIHYHHSLTHPQHSPECIARKSQAGAPSLWGTRVMLLIRLVTFSKRKRCCSFSPSKRSALRLRLGCHSPSSVARRVWLQTEVWIHRLGWRPRRPAAARASARPSRPRPLARRTISRT